MRKDKEQLVTSEIKKEKEKKRKKKKGKKKKKKVVKAGNSHRCKWGDVQRIRRRL
jgi:hypothetical protein